MVTTKKSDTLTDQSQGIAQTHTAVWDCMTIIA